MFFLGVGNQAFNKSKVFGKRAAKTSVSRLNLRGRELSLDLDLSTPTSEHRSNLSSGTFFNYANLDFFDKFKISLDK